VEPLKRALSGNAVWITGLRAEHSAARQGLQQLEWDSVNQIIKYHPLLHWTTERQELILIEHNIPYNPIARSRLCKHRLCALYTRHQAGEDFRAGRWWWEDNSKKECGLHEKQITKAGNI
jgi:phosphoadenosine phosphosulfate reductase